MLSLLLVIPLIGSLALMMLPSMGADSAMESNHAKGGAGASSGEGEGGVVREFGRGRGDNSGLYKRIALTTALINFIVSIKLWIEFDSNCEQFQFVEEWSRISSFCHVQLGIDGISLLFVILTTFIMPLAILASWSTIPHQNGQLRKYLVTLLILETILIAVFVVLDLLLFYIAFESSLIPMFLLIGIFGGRSRKIHAAYQFFLYTLLGSLFMLLAIGIIVSETGTTDYQLLALTEFSSSRQNFLWLGLFLSFAVKTPMVPVHIWLPEAHAEANVSGSVILAGILLKLAGYGFLRYSIGIFPDASQLFTPLVYSISVISIVYSSLATLRQVDFKKIIAYSSIGHMSVVNLGIFSNSISGIEGGIFLMLAHGIVSPALFIMVTFLYDRHHTRIIKYYRGLVIRMPLFAFLFFIFTLANVATPLSGNFVGEFLVFSGAFLTNPLLTAIGAFGMVLGAGYGIWFYNRICFATLSPYLPKLGLSDINRREFHLVLPLLFLVFFMGILPNFFLEPIHLPVSFLIVNAL